MAESINYGIVKKQRKNILIKELFRKTIHICSSFVPFLLSKAFVPIICLLVLALVCYIISEVIRLKGYSVPIISKITETAARKRDENKFVLGPVTLVCGVLLAALILPLRFAKIGIFALAFGDGLASLVGKLIGKVTIPGAHGKTVAGSLACFSAVFISTFYCTGNCLASLIIATAAMIIEVLPLADLDNVLIPVSIGFIAMMIM